MGTGLGMAIVKNLLERMNGEIQIDSEKDVGTTVHVQIPFRIAEEELVEHKTQKSLPHKQQKKIRVLLAEDNDLNREIASFILQDEGIEVIEAMDGRMAVSLFLKRPEYYFDAILMDIMMPSLDGYQAARVVRSSGKQDAHSIPIIAMTANAFDDDRKKSKAAGMNTHLTKPLDAQQLIQTIEKFCGGQL